MSSRTMVHITRMAASLWSPNLCNHGQWYSLHAGQPPCGLPIYVLTDNGTHYPQGSLLVDSQYMSSRTMVLTTRRAASLCTPTICPQGQWYSLHAGQPPCGLPIYVLTDNDIHYQHDSLLVDSQSMSSRTTVLTTRRAAPSWIARQSLSTTWRRSCGLGARHGTVLYSHCHQLYTYLFYQCTILAQHACHSYIRCPIKVARDN